MTFANVIQEETHHKLREYLDELFEEPFHDPETDHWYVRYGSTVLEISNEPYGPEESVVTIMAYCVQGVEIEDRLLRNLLKLNHQIHFGSFSLVGDDLFLSHSLFGRTLTRPNLLTAISAVAELSDEYDDQIVEKYGGQTALQRIQDTGGFAQRRASRVS